MSNEIQSPLTFLESKIRLEKQIQEKSTLLEKMLCEKASMRCPSIEDFPENEEYFFEREEYMLCHYNKLMATATRMIREVEDDLSALGWELTQLRENFMVSTTVEFPLTSNCY
jgi:glutaredoxin 2